MRMIDELVTGVIKEISVPRGRPGYPVPDVIKKKGPGISHLDEVDDAEFSDWISKLSQDKLEISEKIDGSCRIMFGVEDGDRLWVSKKNGERIYSSSVWEPRVSNQSIKSAHAALEKRREAIVAWFGGKAQNDVIFMGDVLCGPIPNAIPYGPNMIVLHSILVPGGCAGPGLTESMCNDLIASVLTRSGGVGDGWGLSFRRSIPKEELAGKIPLGGRDRNSVYTDLVKSSRKIRSGIGGGEIEGVILRDPGTGKLAKIVDKAGFTALNRFLWKFSERLGRGTRSDGKWQPGIMSSLDRKLSQKILGDNSIQGPNFVRKLAGKYSGVNTGPTMDEVLGKFAEEKNLSLTPEKISELEICVSDAQRELDYLSEEWNNEKCNMTLTLGDGRVMKIPKECRERVDREMMEAFQDLKNIREELRSLREMADQRAICQVVLRIAMGPNRIGRLRRMLGNDASQPVVERILRSLTESRADKVAVTIGRYQPFHAGHGKIVRQLASRVSKVLICVAGNKQGEDNPFSYELRIEIMKESLLDIVSKIEFHPAVAGGKPSGYLPGILNELAQSKDSTIDDKTSITVSVGADRFDDMKRMFDKAQESDEYHLGPAIVERVNDIQDDETAARISATRVREALKADNKEQVMKLMDPHLISNNAKFEELYKKMRVEMGLKSESKITEVLDDIGGKGTITQILAKNAKRLLKKNIHVDKLKELGSGKEGVAFDLGGNKVLKVTSDQREAVSSNLIKSKGGTATPNLVKIYDVFRFIDTGVSDPIYGIIQEKLEELDNNEGYEFDRLANVFTDDAVLKIAYNGSFDEVMQGVRKVLEKRASMKGMFEPRSPDQTVDPFGRTDKKDDVRTKPAKLNVNTQTKQERGSANLEKEFQYTLKLMKHYQIDKILEQLRHLGIKFADFHSGNLMKRGSTFVINDIGRSRSTGDEPPVLEGLVETILAELAGGSAGSSMGMGGSTMNVRGGSSAWSAPRKMADDAEEELWQNQLVGLQPIDRRKPEDVPKSTIRDRDR